MTRWKWMKWTLLATVFLVCAGGGYASCIYRGYLLFNNPSPEKYPVTGVDLSHYQGEVDWERLSQEPITFAYIKATEGSSHVDSRFAQNWEGAGETGLLAGAYHFFSFDSPGETQAVNFITQVPAREGMLPPVVDVEYYGDKKENRPDGEAVREQLQIMLELLTDHYQMPPVLYCTEEMWTDYLDGSFEDYPLWIRNVFTKPKISDPWTFWQYTNRGRLDGYAGDEEFIDLNVFYGDEEQWAEWLAENGVK